jgi:hypothetical protein
VVSLTHWPLYPRESVPVPIEWGAGGLGGLQRRSGRFGVKDTNSNCDLYDFACLIILEFYITYLYRPSEFNSFYRTNLKKNMLVFIYNNTKHTSNQLHERDCFLKTVSRLTNQELSVLSKTQNFIAVFIKTRLSPLS